MDLWIDVVRHWYVAAAPVWLGLTQFLKLAQPRITEFLARLVHRVVETDDQSDDARLLAFVGSFRYWLLNEIFDLLFRIKLPTLEDVRQMATQARLLRRTAQSQTQSNPNNPTP